MSPAALADPGAPLDPGPARSFDATATLRWQPSDAFRAQGSYTRSRLFRTDTRRLAHEENIYSAQATRQFGRFAFLRARADYATLATRLRGQLLAAWTPSPGTAVYLGYDDALDGDGPAGGARTWARGFRREARAVFAKLSVAR